LCIQRGVRHGLGLAVEAAGGTRIAGHCGGCIAGVAGAAGAHAPGLAQLGQKVLFLGAGVAIGLAHADRHFIGQLARFGVELGEHGGQLHTAQQHILVQAGQVHLLVTGQTFGHLADLFALAIVLLAIGEGCQKADGQGGANVFRGHGVPR
jgi:hypothetical protein